MKMIILLLLILRVLYSGISFSQLSQPVRLTNGSNDRNPSFSKGLYYVDLGGFEYELLVFERVSGKLSQICVSKIGPEGPVDSAVYLTSDLYTNINPAISYNPPSYASMYSIKHALIAWQSNKFGRESIFGCSYNSVTGWTSPFIIDTTNINNNKPSIYSLDSVNYIIAYESGEDIKYKKYNIITHILSVERNLTALESGICTNPQITSFNNQFNNNEIAISFEKEISPTQKAIYYRTGYADSISLSGNGGDTIAFAGVNHNLGFGRNSLSRKGIFETNRNGNINIYASGFVPFTLHSQNPVVINSAYDNLNYEGTDFPITDAEGLTNLIFGYNKKSLNGLKITIAKGFSAGDTSSYKISNDPLYQTKIAINIALRVPNYPCQRFWFVYNKDSSDSNYPSTIFGISYTICFTEIKQNNPGSPNNFSLSQNFPNPFNPKTIINYEIPSNVNRQTSDVKLIIYNALGKEVAVLVNENQNAGNYFVEWDAGNFPSGIYYYKLTVESFSQVKKMILLK